MHPDRLRHLYQENKDDNGEYILYWMQRSQRVNYNHCLSHAIRLANANKLPLVVVFNLTNSFLGASSAHFIFMIEGLKEVKDNLKKLGINFIIKVGNFTENISN